MVNGNGSSHWKYYYKVEKRMKGKAKSFGKHDDENVRHAEAPKDKGKRVPCWAQC
jgi:hypothetical protein